MNEESNSDNLQNVPDQERQAERERRLENRAEQWGQNLEKKIDRFESKIPRPLSALMDAVCLGLVLPAVGWLLAKAGWIAIPSWKTIGMLCGIAFLASLAIRTVRKPPGPGKGSE